MPKNKILNSVRTRSTSLLAYTGIGSASLLASLPVFLTLGPVLSSPSASAEEIATGLVTATVNSALSISATPVSITATPSVGNTFVTGTSTVTVKNTGSPYGYHLTMSSNNGGSLKNGSNSIPTISGSYSKTGNAMRSATGSSWGYTTETVQNATNDSNDLGRTFYPIPTSSTAWTQTGDSANNKYAYLAKTTGYTNTSSGDPIKVGYGFSIGPGTSSGAYTDTITYTVYADEDMTNTIFNMTNMQDLATYEYACKNTPTPAASATTSMTSLTGAVRAEGISTVPTKTLKDTRDNNTYTVKKLADGNCWMTQNLAISNYTLKPSDSHVTANHPLPASSTSGFSDDNAENVYVDTSTSNGYGGYYTYKAATAGTGGTSFTSGNATQDICPKGWRLPTKAEFDSLKSKYGWSNSAAWTAAPFDGKLAGYYNNSSLDNNGSLSRYWSSTANDGTRAYYLSYSSSAASTDYGYKNYGRSVRCVFGS